MITYKPSTFYHHWCKSRADAAKRLKFPLHYHLASGDIVAFRKELRAGSSPFVNDERGRNALDVLIEILEDALCNCLCSSFPIDDLVDTMKLDQLLPGKFCIEDSAELYQTIYTEPEKALYKAFADGDPDLGRNIQVKPLIFQLRSRQYPAQHISTPDISHYHVQNNEEKLVLLAIANFMKKPISYSIRTRLHGLLKRARVLLSLMRDLCTCKELIDETIKSRKKWYDVELKSTDFKNPGLFFGGLGVPYLYVTLIRILLELYPNAPDGERWVAGSPNDVRILCGLVSRLELPGNFLILFLAEIVQTFSDALQVLPEGYLNPPTQVAQYLAHMAYVLDVPILFSQIVKVKRARAFQGSPFDWENTLRELKHSTAKGNPVYRETLELYLSEVKLPNNFKRIDSEEFVQAETNV